MADDSRFTHYWLDRCTLKMAAVTSRWGNKGLWYIDSRLNPFRQSASEVTFDEAMRQFEEEWTAAKNEANCQPISIDSVEHLRGACREWIGDLREIAAWQAFVENPLLQELKLHPGREWIMRFKYTPNSLIESVFDLVDALPSANRPPFPDTPRPPLSIPDAQFALRRVIEWCNVACPEDHGDPPTADPPHWDPELRRLTLGGKVAKTISPRAKEPILIVTAFQEEGWPGRIDSPLKQHEDPRHLSEVLRSLNRNVKYIRFVADGTGEGVIWERC